MKYVPKLSHTPPLIKQKLEESFGESPESLESELVSSSHELDDSSSPAASLALRFPRTWVRTQEFLSFSLNNIIVLLLQL